MRCEGAHFGVKFSKTPLCGGRRCAPCTPAQDPEDELSNYSFHSFRIFLACALLAAGCPRWMIKRMLRWRGDESLEIYARVSDGEWELRLNGRPSLLGHVITSRESRDGGG